MKIKKTIKPSKRGLTFSFDGFGSFEPGKKYRYILDKSNGRLMIFPVKEREKGLKVSRKKSNGKIKSLLDIRNKDVLSIMNEAEFLEIEIADTEIIITAMKKAKSKAGQILSIDQHLEKIGSFQVAKEMLNASGYGGSFHQYSLSELFGSVMSEGAGVSVHEEVKKDFPCALKIISLFSGAGMLDYPFSKDKHFEIVYAAEYDMDAVTTYKKNIGDHIHQVDIRTLKGSDLPEADIIIGGPPCQPYSRANPSKEKRGKTHEEGDMLTEYIRLVKETNVKVFLIENVPQLLTDSFGENMNLILSELKDWTITSKVIKDCDVGGYTKRKRAFVIGSRIGEVDIPDMVIRPVKTAGQAIEKVNEKWANYDDVTFPGVETKHKISLIPEGGNWENLPVELRTKSVHSNMYRRLDRNEPSVTICNWRKCVLSPPRYDNSGYWDRILTVAEAAALSGLDGKFSFFGKLSSKQQQVGNGVPVALGKFVKSIIKQLFGCEESKKVYV